MSLSRESSPSVMSVSSHVDLDLGRNENGDELQKEIYDENGSNKAVGLYETYGADRSRSRSRYRSSSFIRTDLTDEDDDDDFTKESSNNELDANVKDKHKKEESVDGHNINNSLLFEEQCKVEKSSNKNIKKTDMEVFTLSHNSGLLPGSFAVSLVDRNYDPSLTIVFHCWICDAEFLDKLGIIKHLKEWHMDFPGVQGIEKKMRVPICLTCGLSGGCEHHSVDEDAKEDEEEDENVVNKIFSEDGVGHQSHGGKFSCPLCNISFASTYEQRDHFSKEHPNQKMYKCNYCPDSFYQHHKLVVHTRTHTGYKPYACGICGNKFPKNSDLNRHIRTHASKGEKPYQCAQCGQTFTQKCSLEKHARRHAEKDGGHPCFHCGLTFAYASDLDAHSAKEHGERIWKCEECGKLFEERRHLIVHAKTHQEGIKYQCSFCDRTFTKRHQLAKHEDRIHHRQDDLKCKVCFKEFRRRENLTRHMNIHLDKREFECLQCGMAFTEKGSLRRHVLSRHEQHRPFKCRLCGKAFSRRFLLRKHHIRTHPSFAYEGEENPVPSRGFGAKLVNIDRYICRKTDTGSNSHTSVKGIEQDSVEQVNVVQATSNETEEFAENVDMGSLVDDDDDMESGFRERGEEDTAAGRFGGN